MARWESASRQTRGDERVNETSADENPWVVMRRVHSYISDLIAHRLHQMHVGSNERRLLEALAYAHLSGVESVPTSTLCDMVPVSLAPSTATSTLERMGKRGWIRKVSEPGSLRRWELTEAGKVLRRRYCQEIEDVFRVVFFVAYERSPHVLAEHAHAAAEFLTDEVLPILRVSARGQPVRSYEADSLWASLRQAHFYVDDAIFRVTEPYGVGRLERRVLDTLSYARKHGAADGLNIGTMCRLNEALSRQACLTTLERIEQLDWVQRIIERSDKTKTRPRTRWKLCVAGTEVRDVYKRRAQEQLVRTYEASENSDAELLDLVQSGQNHRDSRFAPALDYYKQASPNVGQV